MITGFLLTACSSKSSAPPKKTSDSIIESSADDAGPSAPGGSPLIAGRRRFQPLAIGGDGFPRMTRVLDEASGKVARLDFDFNADGRIEFSQYFDATGTWVRKEATDLDGDGAFDVLSSFEKRKGSKTAELVLQEFNARYENRPSVWKEYRNGALVRRAIDRRGRGRPDYWESYDANRLVRVDRDDDGDGRPDKGARYPELAAPEGPEPGKAGAR